uniref:Uncharacterized protein n=1 Tax=viral metagenome TaxID=1070528 RepID=A0A6M3L364_9ZZZZ
MNATPELLTHLQTQLSIPVTEMCWLLGVSRTAWYDWMGRPAADRRPIKGPSIDILVMLLAAALRNHAAPAMIRRLAGLELSASGTAVRRWPVSDQRLMQCWAYVASHAVNPDDLAQEALALKGV